MENSAHPNREEGSFQERLNWILDRRSMSPTELSLKTGLSRQYINNLLHGHKENPTLDVVRKLAGALKTTVAFLGGETTNPDPWIPEEEVPEALFKHLLESDALQEKIQLMTVEDRVERVVHFLLARFSDQFTLLELSYQLGLTKRALDDVLAGRCDVSPFTLEALVRITGVDMKFFATGELPPPVPTRLTQARAGRKNSIQEK